MTVDRSARREVRNPLLALPEVQALADLPPEVRRALCSSFRAIRKDCLARADKAWRSHKGPMAAYWKASGVYAGHLARVLSPAPSPMETNP